MADKKINEFDATSSAAATDLMLVGDPTTGKLRKIEVEDFSADLIEANEATEAEALAGTSMSTAITPRRLRAGTPSITIAPSGDASGATDTAAIQAAIDAAPVRIALKPGTFYVDGLTIKSATTIQGAGRDSTVIKLANSSNSDVIVSEGFSGLTGGTTQGGLTSFKLADLTVDGNRANNSSGWCLRVYARKYTIDNVSFTEGKSGGVWTQWGSGGTNMDSHWSNFKIYNCEGNLLDHNGPHDSVFVNGVVFNDGTQTDVTGKLVYVRGQSSGSQFANCHFWGNCAYAVDVINETYFANCQAEGATTANVRFQSNFSQWVGGHIFGTTTGTELGIELGVPAVTSAKGCLIVNTKFSRFASGSFPIKFSASAGSNVVSGQIGASVTATAVYTGTANTTVGSEDRIDIRSSSPSGLATSWQVPKIQSRRLWIPAADFEVVAGSPALSVVQSTLVYSFDASSVESVGTSVMLPSWWTTCDVIIRWANAAGGSGDVVWAFRYDFIAAGQTMGTYSSMFRNALTAGSQDVVMEQTQDGDLTNVADQAVLIRIERTANNVADTLANDANLIGVEFLQLT